MEQDLFESICQEQKSDWFSDLDKEVTLPFTQFKPWVASIWPIFINLRREMKIRLKKFRTKVKSKQ